MEPGCVNLLSPSTRLARPRIPPREPAAWSDADRALAKSYTRDGGAGNDFRTFLNNPDTVTAMMPFISYVSAESGLSPRDREILILRTGWLAQSDYVWAHHSAAAKAAGLTDTITLFRICVMSGDVSVARRYTSSISISDGPVSPLCKPPIKW